MFILASKSKIRAELLINAGLNPELIPADIDERALELSWAKDSASHVAEKLAVEKALAVSNIYKDKIVIGADQTLEIEGLRLSKAPTIADVERHLKLMRGKTHYLHAGVAVAKNGEKLFSSVETAAMSMREFSDEFLEKYLTNEGEKVKSSVGCYQFEGAGIALFEKIEGSYHTILGMPLLPLLNFLRLSGKLAA
jgi:septum formation protein